MTRFALAISEMREGPACTITEAIQDKVQRFAVIITGRVQGVGFRPFVYHLARRHSLQGFVRNVKDRVHLEVEGSGQNLRGFFEELRYRPPALSKIEQLHWENRPVVACVEPFRIEPSSDVDGEKLHISPDIATCAECVRELSDPSDRRYRYPFLNCVNCGPRFTILQGLPYDRGRTTMKQFALCHECATEFHDPMNRRFHAQPVACPRCGPQVDFKSRARTGSPGERHSSWLESVVDALRRGECVALKGLGGYHLTCDATNADAVRRLRQGKRRDEKPLAVMVANEDQAREVCELTDQELQFLTAPSRPILLLRRRSGTAICHEVSQASPYLGVMLPYTPLHHLLLQGLRGVPLVMTSANESGQPIVFQDVIESQALERIADALLTHDREIQIRCDDSVMRVADPEGEAIPVLIRRSRGFAPEAIALPVSLEVPALALGAHLKNTFALGTGSYALPSHHIGDLDELATYEAYQREIDHYEMLFGLRPQVLIHDLHPNYLSTHYAIQRAKRDGIRTLQVQHHQAHVASCMADNGLSEQESVIGVAFDGTGYGLDGKIWGGEFFVGNYEHFERVGHLAEVAMPGGELAVQEPWRMALAYLLEAGFEPNSNRFGVSSSSVRTLQQLMARGFHFPMTSSVGRLFDGAAALLGVRAKASFEGQAAMELEALAMRENSGSHPAYDMPLSDNGETEPFRVEILPMIRGMEADIRRGVPGSEIAGRFHESLIQMIVRVCEKLRRASGLDKVVLSGGVFMNGILLSGAVRSLKNHEFQVFFHRQVPPNDGGLCLGQLAVGAARLRREKENVSGGSWEAGGNLPRA